MSCDNVVRQMEDRMEVCLHLVQQVLVGHQVKPMNCQLMIKRKGYLYLYFHFLHIVECS